MAETIPVDATTSALSQTIIGLEKKVAGLESDNRNLRSQVNEKQSKIDRLHEAREAADEVHQNIIDKLLQRLEDR